MAKKFFNRKDAQVLIDLENLEYDQFIDKYKDQTNETVLKTVWNDAHKNQAKKGTTLPPVPLPGEAVEGEVVEPIAEFVTEDKVEVKISKTKKGSTVVETDDLKLKPVKGAKKVKEEDLEEDIATEVKDKPGRTPRMRELIAELGKDKAIVRAKLEEEGFNCNGSGFHSEWNRVSKSIADKEA